jgi:hypothetical protein
LERGPDFLGFFAFAFAILTALSSSLPDESEIKRDLRCTIKGNKLPVSTNDCFGALRLGRCEVEGFEGPSLSLS